jgi:hypothetical protein
MLRTIESVVLFVPDLEDSIPWYRLVLGTEPEVVLERTATFRTGSDLNLQLVDGEGERQPGSAVLVCLDLEAALLSWREWAGVVETECLGPDWPVQLVTLRDPGGNCLVVVEAAPRGASVGAVGTA